MTEANSGSAPITFTIFHRVVHWTMAVLIIAMLFIGAAMVGYLQPYPTLLRIHEALGLAILILAVVRVVSRLVRPPSGIETVLSRPERIVATTTEYLMYGLFLAQPLIGWGLISASGQPMSVLGVCIPAITPINPDLYSALRTTHAVLAYSLLAVIVAHICAVLSHTLVMRDSVITRMTGSRRP